MQEKGRRVVAGHHKTAAPHLQLPVPVFTHVQVRKQEITGKYVYCSTFSLCFYANCCFCCVSYRLSCNQRVVIQLRSRTSGNSANRLYNTLWELHTATWMRRATQYLGVCEQFLALCSVREPFLPPPQMRPLASPVWLLMVYGYNVLTHLVEYKARITSTFYSILKMDSTKMVGKV